MKTNMVSDTTRKAVWHMMLDLERQFRYCSALADRHGRYYKIIRYLLLFGIVAEGTLLYFAAGDKTPVWILAGIGAALIGVLTVYDASTNYAETSARLRATSEDLDALKSKAERLWRDIEAYRVTDQESEARHNDLVKDWTLCTRRITIHCHDKENRAAAIAADRDVMARYGE